MHLAAGVDDAVPGAGAGMRIVAPAIPEIAVSVNSSAWLKGKPRLSICTVMIPHMPQTAKPHSSAGTEIQRLR